MRRPSRRSSNGSRDGQPALVVGGIALAVMLGMVVLLVTRLDREAPVVKGPTVVVPTSKPRPIPLPVVPASPDISVTTRPPTTVPPTTADAPPTTTAPATTTTSRPPTTTTTRPCTVALLGRCLTP